MSPLRFGVATAGFQVEGGFNGPGEPRNNWFDREQRGKIERSGVACDSWNRWEEDLDAVAAMGLDWYRLGVEWARLQPSTRSMESNEPAWDDAAVGRYVDMLAGARERGVEPLVTLHHFTHPRWLGLDLWQRAESPRLFAAYAAEAARRMGEGLVERGQQPLLRYVTLNEPNVLAFQTWATGLFPGGGMGRLRSVRPALANLLAAHVLAYAALHRLHRDRGWPDPIMTTNTYTNSVYELDRGLVDVLPDAVPRPWKDPPRPRSFRAFVRAATDHGLPVWILENGLCNRVKDGVSFPRGDGWTRTRYLQEHVPLVAELTASGAPVELYVHWSLYDNYEWGSYEPRFGIHGIDRIGARPQRMAVDSMGGDSAATYAGLVRDLRDG